MNLVFTCGYDVTSLSVTYRRFSTVGTKPVQRYNFIDNIRFSHMYGAHLIALFDRICISKHGLDSIHESPIQPLNCEKHIRSFAQDYLLS